MWLGNLAKRNQDNPTTLWQIIWKIVKTRDAFEQSKKQNFPQGCDMRLLYWVGTDDELVPRYMTFPCKVHQRSFVLFREKKILQVRVYCAVISCTWVIIFLPSPCTWVIIFLPSPIVKGERLESVRRRSYTLLFTISNKFSKP